MIIIIIFNNNISNNNNHNKAIIIIFISSSSSSSSSSSNSRDFKQIATAAFSSPEAAIHLASAMDRDLWPAPIFSPRLTDFRSFCAVSCFYQNRGSGKDRSIP